MFLERLIVDYNYDIKSEGELFPPLIYSRETGKMYSLQVYYNDELHAIAWNTVPLHWARATFTIRGKKGVKWSAERIINGRKTIILMEQFTSWSGDLYIYAVYAIWSESESLKPPSTLLLHLLFILIFYNFFPILWTLLWWQYSSSYLRNNNIFYIFLEGCNLNAFPFLYFRV